MARPQRSDAPPASAPSPTTTGGYQPGGRVGRMQADLADRLAPPARAWAPAPANVLTGEQAVRFVSVASGYLALLAGYAGVALLILR